MGTFFTNSTTAPIIKQVTFQPPRHVTRQERIANTNKELQTLINDELLPKILTVEQLSMLCHGWFRQSCSNESNPKDPSIKISDDVTQIIFNHYRYEALEYELMNKIIENHEIESAIQWFFEQNNMQQDPLLIAEILSSKRKYINREYMTPYWNQASIDKTSRIKYLKLCGLNESLIGFEACFRYFLSECGLYLTSRGMWNDRLLFSALTKLMLLNGNIKNIAHRRIFEYDNDADFIPRLMHAMFCSTANAAHYRHLATHPSNMMQVNIADKYAVMADFMQIFEEKPLVELGSPDYTIDNMVQVTM